MTEKTVYKPTNDYVFSRIFGYKKNWELLKDLLESILNKDKIDRVIHLVSTIVPGSSYDDFIKEFTNVIFPSIRLMELCSKKNVKFVYFSSGGTIYGDRKGNARPL